MKQTMSEPTEKNCSGSGLKKNHMTRSHKADIQLLASSNNPINNESNE